MPRTDTTLNEFVVLSVLAEEPLYGYAITKRVAALSEDQLRLTPGVLYPLLKRLEKGGLVSATWETVKSDRSEEDSGGRRRKWYRLSPKGKRRLVQQAQAQRERQRLIEAFLPPEPEAGA